MGKYKGLLTYKNKQILTITLLACTLFYPLLGLPGLILMWVWMKWQTWVKVLITLPFVIILLAYASVLTYVGIARPVQIVGETMVPNYSQGQFYITNVLNDDEIIARGDVIVYSSPESNNADLVKRVVALPNERIVIEGGQVYVSGERLDESTYLTSQTETFNQGIMSEGEEFTVPAGSYFVMGDNRYRSADSRVFGPVNRDAIKSKVGFCYWNCWKL